MLSHKEVIEVLEIIKTDVSFNRRRHKRYGKKDQLDKTYDNEYEALTQAIEILKRVDVLKFIDTIIDFMRINKNPDKGFMGNLKQVGIEDINDLAQAICEWLEKGEK